MGVYVFESLKIWHSYWCTKIRIDIFIGAMFQLCCGFPVITCWITQYKESPSLKRGADSEASRVLPLQEQKKKTFQDEVKIQWNICFEPDKNKNNMKMPCDHRSLLSYHDETLITWLIWEQSHTRYYYRWPPGGSEGAVRRCYFSIWL